MKIFPTPTFMEQVFIRNRHFLPHFFLKILDVLTILWTFYMVTSIKFLKIWNLQDLSFHLTPCLLSLTKIENWPKIWKWNAKAIKHKCAPLHCVSNRDLRRISLLDSIQFNSMNNFNADLYFIMLRKNTTKRISDRFNGFISTIYWISSSSFEKFSSIVK